MAPARLCCPHPQRYYGPIRRSRVLRPASPSAIPARSLSVKDCTRHLPFFALTDLLDVPPPLPRRSSRCREWEPSPFGLWFGLRWFHSNRLPVGAYVEAAVVRLMLRPANLLGSLVRPRASCLPVLIRLRQSLPNPKSPSDRVCYGYSVPLLYRGGTCTRWSVKDQRLHNQIKPN